MSRISTDDVKHVAHLARLAVTEEEVQKMTKELDAIISFAEQLNELDTTNVKPTYHVLEMKNVMREDVVSNDNDRENMLKNAPQRNDDAYIVPETF